MAAQDPTAGVKLQAKIDGYEAWAFLRYMEHAGRKNHDACRTIIREWFHLKRDELQDEYGISREEWEREKGGNVLPMAGSQKAGRKPK